MNTTPREAVRALAPAIRAQAERIELERRLPVELVRALARAGVFRLCVPRTLGGEEAEPGVLVGALEDLAHADGSTGWCAMIGATSGVTSAYLPEREARDIFGRSREVIAGGVFAPMGSATREGADYRVTGRWRFASGCQHCDWLMGGCIVRDDGLPRARMVLFPAGDAEIVDTWTVSGLRGTGSHDMVVRDLRVPVTRIADIVGERRGITADTALRLARYFKNMPVFWMNLQTRYELEVAEDEVAAQVERDVHPLETASRR